MPRSSRLIIALFLIISFLAFLSAPAGASFIGLSGSSSSYPAKGVEVRTITELTKDGWLRYAFIRVDTKVQGIYAGPFNADLWMDKPASVLDTLKSKDLVAAVNGDFFDTSTGMPLSMVVSQGVLIRSPRKDSEFSTLCIPAGGSGYIMDFTWSARLVRQNGSTLDISSYNELSVGGSDAVLFNALRQDRKYPPNCAIALIARNTVLAVGSSNAVGNASDDRFKAVPFEFEIVATGSKAGFIRSLSAGETVRMEFNLFPPYPMQSAFSGKPVLMENGVKTANLASYASIQGNLRAPRTMAGIDRDGKLILVAVEGRTVESRGLTLDEAAELMARLGCRDALNLDGGGSTQLAASDGAAGYRLIGSTGADRKVSYSIGVTAIDELRASPAPSLIASPPYGESFEIPAVGPFAQPGEAYLGIVSELPRATEGTILYMQGMADVNDIAIEGPLRMQDDASFVLTGPGLVRIALASPSGSYEYQALATGRPDHVELYSLLMGEDGLSFSCSVVDSSGRHIFLPAAGLRAVATGLYGSALTSSALFTKESLEGIGRITKVSFFLGEELLSSFDVDIAGKEKDAQASEVTLSDIDRISEWTAISAPQGALTGVFEVSLDGRQAFELAYDFNGTGLRAAYLKPNTAIPIPDGYSEVRIWANADLAGGHWLRANVRDTENRRLFLDFGRLSPGGWKQYAAKLPEGVTGLSIEQVYLVEFKDEISSKGTLVIDLLTAVKPDPVAIDRGLVRLSVIDRTYKPAKDADLGEEAASIVAQELGYAESKAKHLELDCTGGFAYKNGTGQLQRLFEACNVKVSGGALLISLRNLAGSPSTGTEPLSRLKDANERKLISSLAERAAFMGYETIAVVEHGAEVMVLSASGGVIYIGLP